MDAQDMVKVDPKLFVTCRLCLEEMGTYQLTPLVREQFKYCFDIDVDPFDGLPQLICEACQTVLSDYSTKKRIYIGRQNALKAQLQVRKEIHLESVTSTQQIEDNVTRRPCGGKRRHSRRESISSTNTSRYSNLNSPSPSPSPGPSPIPNVGSSKSAKRKRTILPDISKSVICRFCGKYFKTRGNIVNHLRYKHAKLRARYPNVLSKYCLIKLEKLDELPNDSGIPNTVMLDRSKIISQEKTNNYYIQYWLPNDAQRPVDRNSDSESDEVTGAGTNRKRQRLVSTDTVVLNNENKHSVSSENKEMPKDVECINIDDSSNSSSENLDKGNSRDQVVSDQVVSNNNEDEANLKAMQSLVNMCYNKYMRKCESNKVDPGLLTHKILSIGRKVISKDGNAFNSTGLLRYMENKNLEIKWLPTDPQKRDNNIVRIMTMLRPNNSQSNDTWRRIKLSDKKPKEIKISAGSKNPPETNNELFSEHVQTVETIKTSTSNENASPAGPLQTSTELENKILLNANPVANPRQLPKKGTGMPIITSTSSLADMVQTESKQTVPVSSSVSILLHNGAPVTANSSACLVPLNNDNEGLSAFKTSNNEMLHMPVITSTTSLAVPKNGTSNVNNSVKEVQDAQPAQPRIKVKPVSQLMSDRALKSLNDQNVQNQTNVHNQPLLVSGEHILQVSPLTAVPINVQADHPAPTDALNLNGNPQEDTGKVILHTVEFPNTITDSPFRYFRNLLQVHNIVLLDPNTNISPNFICLIKFKLQFLWESTNQPVTLCLTVHCSGNMYILGVKDQAQANNIDLNKLSAIWQWQILKIYFTRDDIVGKMLSTAQKTSPEVHENTKRFICLLKSISCRMPPTQRV